MEVGCMLGYNVQMDIFTECFSFLGIWDILAIYEIFYLTNFQCSFSVTTAKNFIKLCTNTCIYILVDFFPL